MTILKETLNLLKALYVENKLQPAQLVRMDSSSGWTIVVGTQKLCGTAFRFSGPHNVYQNEEVDPTIIDELHGENLMDIAGRFIDSNIVQLRSIAVAAISALSQPFLTCESIKQRGFHVISDEDCMRFILKPDDMVTLIGYGGMTQHILGKCKELHITDMRPPQALPEMLINEDLKHNHEPVFIHGANEDENLLNICDVAVITASTIVNNTIDRLLHYANSARVRCIYGASSSIIPDILIKYNANIIMTHHLSNPDKLIECVNNNESIERSIRNYQTYQVISNKKLS